MNSLADDCAWYLHTCFVNFNSWKSSSWFAFSSEVQYYCWWVFSTSYTSINQCKSSSFWYSKISLNCSAVRYLWWSLVMFIRSIYDTVKRSYFMFCFLIIRVKYSTSISNMISWLINLKNKMIKVKIIKIYLIDLWSHHIDVEYSDIKIKTFHHFTANHSWNSKTSRWWSDLQAKIYNTKSTVTIATSIWSIYHWRSNMTYIILSDICKLSAYEWVYMKSIE